MPAIIPARQSFGSKLAGALGEAAGDVGSSYFNKQNEKALDKQIKELTGKDVSNMPREFKLAITQEFMKQEGKNKQLENNRKLLEGIMGGQGQGQGFQEQFQPPERQNLPSFMDQLQGNKQKFQMPGMPEQSEDRFETPEIIEQSLVERDLTKIPDEAIAQLALTNKEAARTLSEAKNRQIKQKADAAKIRQKTFESERSYHTQFSKEQEKEAENLRSNLSKKEMSLDLSRNAIESGEVGALSLANIAKRLNIPEWQTMKGAQLETAIKENLLSNMSRISAKGQNIWFEQRLNSMMAQIGKSKEANLAAQEILEGEVALDHAYLNNFDKIAEEDQKKYNFVKKDIAKRARDQTKPFEKEIMQRTAYRLKEQEELEKGLSSIKKQVGKNVIKGTPLTLAMAKLYKDKFGDEALKVAQKNGYYIPTLEEFQIFQQRPQEFREGL